MPLSILHTKSSKGYGGQEIQIIEESKGTIKLGHRVIIAAPAKSNIFTRGKEIDIEVFPVHFQKKNPFSYLSSWAYFGLF